jgi:hypothetical protein
MIRLVRLVRLVGLLDCYCIRSAYSQPRSELA